MAPRALPDPPGLSGGKRYWTKSHYKKAETEDPLDDAAAGSIVTGEVASSSNEVPQLPIAEDSSPQEMTAAGSASSNGPLAAPALAPVIAPAAAEAKKESKRAKPVSSSSSDSSDSSSSASTKQSQHELNSDAEAGDLRTFTSSAVHKSAVRAGKQRGRAHGSLDRIGTLKTGERQDQRPQQDP